MTDPTRGLGASDSFRSQGNHSKNSQKPIEKVEKVGETEFEKPKQKRSQHQDADETSLFEKQMNEASSLPRSDEFFNSVDGLPDDPPERPKFVERNHKDSSNSSKTSEKDRAKEKSHKKKPEQDADLPNPFQLLQQQSKPIGKSHPQKPLKKTMAEQPSKNLPEEETLPKSKPAPFPNEKPPLKHSREQHLWEPEEFEATPQVKKKKPSEPSHRESTPAIRPVDSMPPSVERVSPAVSSIAASYLTKEVAELFKQMVGTIVYMAAASPGISSTVIVLNSAAFQGSPFFNSTITIEQHATARDSFNIRLTGSPQAVRVFNEKIDKLSEAFTAAYQSGAIKVKVSRLEASHRPLVHRKKDADGKNEDDEAQ